MGESDTSKELGWSRVPTVTFDGVPARSVVRLPDGTVLAEAPRDPETAQWRVIDRG